MPKWILQTGHTFVGIAKYLLLIWRLMLAKEMPMFPKAMAVIVSFGYLIWDMDFIPDGTIMIGRLDDLAVFIIMSILLVMVAPRNLTEILKNQI